MIQVPANWRALRERQRDLWNPNAPDNMLVRHLALEAGKADPESFAGHQRRIGSLARSRRAMRLADPTPEQWEAFVARCVAAGMVAS